MLEIDGHFYNPHHIVEVRSTGEGQPTVLIMADGRRILHPETDAKKVAAAISRHL